MEDFKKNRLIYFPGYGSDERSGTYRYLQKHFGAENMACIRYDNADAEQAWQQIVEQIDTLKQASETLFIIGSSLGGYWANRTANHFHLPFVLINPSTNPSVTLAKYGVGPEHLEKFGPSPTEVPPRFIILGENDDVIDPQRANALFGNKTRIIWVNDGHRLNGQHKKVLVAELRALPELQ
ncbi:MAG: hypothetical protein INR69_08725 [Mucilaginibacter polytrichastri]|nr:hypothetical protein [Mucilaginibacter polytrichastri]